VLELHGSGIAPFVQNALRLGNATRGTPRYERLLKLVLDDVERTYHVSDDRKRQLVEDFCAESCDVPMRVCAACGTRDPDPKLDAVRPGARRVRNTRQR